MNVFVKVLGLILCLSIGVSIVFYMDKNNSPQSPSSQIIEVKVCEHKLETGACAFCDPSLIESLGFCHGHGVPEAFCTRCNSSLIVAFKQINDWCLEHKLPDSQCKLCKKTSVPSSKMDPKIGLELFKKPLFRSQKGPSKSCENEGSIIQFVDSSIMAKSGIQTDILKVANDNDFVSCNAQIKYDQNKLAHITPRAKGLLTNITKDLGDQVLKNDILAQIHSNEFSLAKSQYFQALTLVQLWQKNHDSELALQKDGATSAREVLQTRTKLVESQIVVENSMQRIRNLGLSEVQISNLKAGSQSNANLSILAPFSGTISKRHAVSGEMVDTAHTLFTIVNTQKMWAMLDIHPTDLTKVKVNQITQIQIPELAPMVFSGKITWIDSAISKSSRTLKARVELNNESSILKAGMFGQAKIAIHSRFDSLLVHKSSVQWDGCCNVIFVKTSSASFETRRVKLRPSGKHKDYYLVQGNIKANDEIATTGSFLLKTEIMKDNIGAGCCEADAGK